MTYPATQTYWLEHTDEIAWGLRRYASTKGSKFTCETGFHAALVYLEVRPATYTDYDNGRRSLAILDEVPRDDPRWPKTCDKCDYTFTDDDQWQPWQEGIYTTAEGTRYVLHQGAPADALEIPSAPPGACWDAWWMSDWAKGPDGICLMVRCPNGRDWMVDSEASNCTRKGDRDHKCWIRHGDPREAKVTVDKNGETCAAGAGSIQAGDYHGFLQNGVLTAG